MWIGDELESVNQANEEREDLYMESVRAFNTRQGETARLERLEYHEGQARRLSNTIESLVAHHLAEAARYRNGHRGRGVHSRCPDVLETKTMEALVSALLRHRSAIATAMIQSAQRSANATLRGAGGAKVLR